ncbi:hypothetical protein [Arthrobacter sedimenti]|uniref:Uncharacterized protein n=1 Tax=Arthrobacter sedimenti TaxID=2694931 RepID=A0ABV8WRZ3_9MICC
MTILPPVVGYKLSPRIPLEVDLFCHVNPGGRIPTDVVDPYVVEPAIVEPLDVDLYEDFRPLPCEEGNDGYFEAINRAPLGEGGLWDAHTADQYQPNDLTYEEPEESDLKTNPQHHRECQQHTGKRNHHGRRNHR